MQPENQLDINNTIYLHTATSIYTSICLHLLLFLHLHLTTFIFNTFPLSSLRERWNIVNCKSFLALRHNVLVILYIIFHKILVSELKRKN